MDSPRARRYMADIHIKKDKVLKDTGGTKPFGIDVDPNNDLCLIDEKEKGKEAFYKGKKMDYMDYYDCIFNRARDGGKSHEVGSFSGFGPGTLKKPYMESKNG